MNNIRNSRLILDWDCFSDTVPMIAAYGNRPLLLASPRATRMGWSQVICSRLADATCPVPYVAEVAGEPTVDLVDSLGAVARQFECDSVIAVGGGAVIDAAKAVAAIAPATFSSWLLTEWGRTGGSPAERPPLNSLPVIAIPTIAAAGSEGNGTGVLTNRNEGTKAVFFDERLQPVFALVDPSLTVGLSPQLTWAGTLDIAAHAVEGLMSDDAPQESARSLCAETLHLILDSAKAAMRDPKDRSARMALSKLAIEVWNGSFSNGTSRWPLHAIAHVVGARLGVPHSRTVAMLMTSWVDLVHQYDPGRLPSRTLPCPDSDPLGISRVSRVHADLLALEVVTTYGDGARLENSFPLGTREIGDLLINVFGSSERA